MGGGKALRFIIDGEPYERSRQDVEEALREVRPDRIQQLAVSIQGDWYPVRQAVGLAIGRSPRDLNSGRSMELLRKLGYVVHDIRQDGPLPLDASARTAPAHIRLEALRLAVQARQPDAAAERILDDANRFASWLDQTLTSEGGGR
jgi:hypothetical protein